MTENPKKKDNKILLIIAVLAFIYIFIPEPTDGIPIFGWLDELFAGGLSITSLLAYIFKYYTNKSKEKKSESKNQDDYINIDDKQ